MDDLLTLELDGEPVLEVEIPAAGPDNSSGLWIELAGEGAEHGGKTNKAEQVAPVLLHRQEDALEVVLNSPGDRNALSVHMRDALSEAFKLVAMDPSIRNVEVSADSANCSFSCCTSRRHWGSEATGSSIVCNNPPVTPS